MRSLRWCVLALTLGCSSEPSTLPAKDSPIQARFEPGAGALPGFLDVPFPSDIYVEADGTIVDTIPGFDGYVTRNAAALEATLASQRGFGVYAAALFRIDVAGKTEPDSMRALGATVDLASLPASEAASLADDASVLLIDLDAASSAAARVPCRAVYHDDRPLASDSAPVLAVLPARGVVLAEGRRYAAVLTTGVKADGGVAIGPSARFRALRDGDRTGALGKLYGEAIDKAAALVPALADKQRIAALTVFTTQSTSEQLVSMRATVASLPTPKLRWDPAMIAPIHAALFAETMLPGYTATLDAWLGTPAKLPDGSDDPARDQQSGAAHGAIAAMGTAVFEAPNFLRHRPGSYQDPAHRTIALDAMGHPVIDKDQPTSKVWITIALPKSPMPAGGFPVVILQHGLQGDRSFLLTLADTFAKRGVATAAIEAVTFGARATDPSNTEDKKSTFPWSAGAAYNGPDGFVDAPAAATALFGAFVNFGASRDQLRQSAVDLGALADVLADPALDLGPLTAAVPSAKLDGARIGYVGDSFGAVTGALVAAIDPRIHAFVLNVGGGGIMTEIVSSSPTLATVLDVAGGLTFGFSKDRLDASHPMYSVIQSILDPADPLLYARRLVKEPSTVGAAKNPPKSVILIEAVWDEILANEGTEALARAAGMPLAAPSLGSITGVPLDEAKPVGGVIQGVPVGGVTTALVQASPATHGSNLYNAHGIRHYALPFGQPGPTPFPVLPMDIPINNPYLGLQAMVGAFFDSAFAGGIPVLKDMPIPLRDFDGDGVLDQNDPAPADPSH